MKFPLSSTFFLGAVLAYAVSLSPVEARADASQTQAPQSDAAAPQLRGLDAQPKLYDPLKDAKEQGTYGTVVPQYDALPPRAGSFDDKPVLRGMAELSAVKGNARLLTKNPLSRHRDGSVRFVELKIKNDGDQVVVIDGTKIEAKLANGVVLPVSKDELVKDASSSLSPLGLASYLAVEAASLALAGNIYYEFITPGQNRNRNLGIPLGRDAPRHEVEAEAFGRRVLMPGDETTGWVGFDCAQLETVTSLKIPISYLPPSIPGGTLNVPVVRP